MENERTTIKNMLNQLTYDEMDRAWNIFYKWGELTMKERRVNIRHWKQWMKNNKKINRKCEQYFPTISVEEGRAKFKEIIGRIIENRYYGIPRAGKYRL